MRPVNRLPDLKTAKMMKKEHCLLHGYHSNEQLMSLRATSYFINTVAIYRCTFRRRLVPPLPMSDHTMAAVSLVAKPSDCTGPGPATSVTKSALNPKP